MDFNKIRELLKGLITENTSTEEVEKIGAINQEVDNAENEYTSFAGKHEELRKKYIDVIKDSSFKEKPKEENPDPKSLEECIQEQIAKR